ncbi:DUF4184 family protein [Nocardioides humilatus]|nr:DUF4184 family protein [Nocardioides humilatus]
MTLAHPMAVLPLRGLGLPATAMVVGSMVPDIPVFLNWYGTYQLSHSLLGIVTWDLVVATIVTFLWFVAVRDAAVDLAPTRIRERLVPHVCVTRTEWLLTPVAAAVGSATHVLWDSFTHVGRWGPRHIEWLAVEHHGLLGLKWAQYTSGVVGLTVVTVVVVLHLRSLAPLPGPRPRPVLPPVVLPLVIVGALIAGTVAAIRKTSFGFRDMAFDGVVHSLIALVVLGALACVAWHVTRALDSVESRP